MVSMPDATPWLQGMIDKVCKNHGSANGIMIERGDYLVQTIDIPKNCKIMLFSKDRVRLVFAGKRNRPLFMLHENSGLVLKEKLELFYNTNNIQEVSRLMIRRSERGGGDFEISKDVKISLFSMKQA